MAILSSGGANDVATPMNVQVLACAERHVGAILTTTGFSHL
jgi:hypothetical protein